MFHGKKSRQAKHSRFFMRMMLPLIAVGMVSISGCMQQALVLGYLIGGPPSIEPDFDRMTQKSMTDKDVTVAVVCYAPKEVLLTNFKVDQVLSRYVSNQLHAHKIKVVNPDGIAAWIDQNPDWERAVEIGEAFEATYVISIDIESYSLYEENSANLYRGRAQAHVRVWEMDESGDGEKVYETPINSIYPLAVPRSTSQESSSTFRRKYLTRLSEDIGRKFYEHYNGDDMPDAT